MAWMTLLTQAAIIVIGCVFATKIVHLLLEGMPVAPQKVLNRTLVFLDEAARQGYGVRATDFSQTSFILEKGGRVIGFEVLPHLNPRNACWIMDDKMRTKRFLKARGIPVSAGDTAFGPVKAMRIARTMGFPLVVKPVNGSLSKGAFFPVGDWTSFLLAFVRAKRHSFATLIERYYDGDTYRATVVGKRLSGIVQRVPPHVLGDGENDLGRLIGCKNRDPRRRARAVKNTTLHHIPIDRRLRWFLRKRGFTLSYVPKKGERVVLDNKVILSRGGDTCEVTTKAHAANKRLFERIAARLGANLAGIDCIMQDIRKPWYDQTTAVLEVNSLPYIDLHHHPTRGRPRNVAKRLLRLAEAASEPIEDAQGDERPLPRMTARR